MVSESLTEDMAGLGDGGAPALRHGVRRQDAGAIRCDAVKRLVQAGGARVTVVDIPAAPLEVGERFPGKGELAYGCRQTPRLGPRETEQRLAGRAGRAGVDAALGGGHIVQIEAFIEALIAEIVVESPGAQRVIDA